LLVPALLAAGGCLSKFGLTRPIRQQRHLNGVIVEIGYGSPRAAGWDQPSRPVPNIVINTDHDPSYAENPY
jgi:hypothetical protein